MLQLPGWVDFVSAERKASGLFRELNRVSADWGELIAIAQCCISYYQEIPIDQITDLYNEENVVPLIAACRVLDTASREKIALPVEDRQSLAIMASVGYAMQGNFLSAAAVLDNYLDVLVHSSDAMKVVLALCVPNKLNSLLKEEFVLQDCRAFVEELAIFLRSGSDEARESLQIKLVKIMVDCGRSYEGALLRSGRLCLVHIFNLATRVVLQPFAGQLGEPYLSKLVGTGISVLLPPQAAILKNNGLLKNSNNALISLPTSTGKTLLGEIALTKSFDGKPGLVCFIVPYKTLARQVHASVNRHVPSFIRVHRLTGSFRSDENLDPTNYMEFVVATPERFDALIRNRPQLLDSLRAVLFDEAHLIENGQRGVKLEGLISRLLLRQEAGLDTRILLLSAVLSEYSSFADWLKILPINIMSNSWKPTARRIAIWRDTGDLCWFVGTDPVRKTGTTSDSMIGSRKIKWKNSIFPESKNVGQEKSQTKRIHQNVAELVNELLESYKQPLLCVVATKASTRALARQIAEIRTTYDTVPESIQKIIEEIELRFHFMKPAIPMLRKRVAYHNSTVPQELRDLIEHSVEKKDLLVVTATTTLAEGADLPFRFTILVDWLFYGAGNRRNPMSGFLFRNVAGRCGRAGSFTEGDTIIVDNPVGESRLTRPKNSRQDSQMNLFLRKDPLLISALADSQDGLDEESQAALASQLMATIPENPNIESVEKRFLAKLYATRPAQPNSSVTSLVDRITASILDESEVPIAKVASPMHLTPFGTAANRTGFSPESCRKIYRWLKGISHIKETDVALESLLRQLSDIPEQQDRHLRKMFLDKSGNFMVKAADLQTVLSKWLTGFSYEEIFSSLPAVHRSSISPKIDAWLSGIEHIPSWDENFDKFVEFMQSSISSFLPWTCRACAIFCRLEEISTNEDQFIQWATFLETGTSNQWAAAFARTSELQISRKLIVKLGDAWTPILYSEGDELGIQKLQTQVGLPQLLIESIYNLPENDINVEEVDKVIAWLLGS